MRKIIITTLLVIGLLPFTTIFCDDSIDALINKYTEDLNSEYMPVRLNAVKALSKILDRKVVNPLIKALYDENKFVRKEACSGLGYLKHPRAVKPLGKLLIKDEEMIVRKECAWALGNMGFVDALPYLEKQLEKEESLSVELEIKKAIEKLND